MSILIVDDSRDDRLLVQSILTAAGHAYVVMAQSAGDAFRLAGIDEHEPMRPALAVDLILMDINMPGMDGLEACRRFLEVERFREVPIIMITGRAESGTLAEAFAIGAMDYITKPFRKVELLARVGSALRLKRSLDICRAQGFALLKKNQELEHALQEIKALRGIIPICEWCKKARDDQGYWSTVEEYIRSHSAAEVSHGICPNCLEKVYPDPETRNAL